MAANAPNIVAIIQARLGSSRLPLKSLLTLKGHAIIDWVTSRVAKSKRLSSLIVAIPKTSLDEILAEHLQRQGINCIMGSEDDVLDRFCMAAQQTSADLVVRVCADNPLIWGEAIDRLIEHYLTNRCDYAYNHIPRNNLWPDGLGAEILSHDLLEELNTKAHLPSQREHCLNYLWDHAKEYSISTFDPMEPWLKRPDLKLDIDSVADYLTLAKLPITPEISMEELISSTTQPSQPT